MEMKDIDLTKCVNCRFRAKVDGKEVVGKIEKPKTSILLTGGDMFGCVVSPTEMDNLLRGVDLTTEDGNFYITDFEIVPRDPETYQDWQVWDTIEYSDNYSTGRIIFRDGDFVAADIEGTCNCYTCDELFNEGYRLVLTDIEQKIIEGKKMYEPQDGDIVAWKDKDDDGDPAVSIYKERDRGYATIFANGLTEYSIYAIFAMNIIRPATEEEKQKLFDAMAKQGKRWNAEKKVVEDIPKPHEFRKGEPVLARDYDNELWALYAYHEQAGNKYIVKTCFQTVLQSQCIPYNERTMHLLGTSEDYKEEQR